MDPLGLFVSVSHMPQYVHLSYFIIVMKNNTCSFTIRAESTLNWVSSVTFQRHLVVSGELWAKDSRGFSGARTSREARAQAR